MISPAAFGANLADAATITSNFSTTSNEADVTGLEVTVPGGERPILLVLWSTGIFNSAAGQFALPQIKEGSTVVGTGNFQLSTAANQQSPCIVMALVSSPTAGAHTYKATFGRSAFSGSGTATMSAAATSPAMLLAFVL